MTDPNVVCASVGTVAPVMRVQTSSPVTPTETTYVDKLGRTVRTEVEAFAAGGTRRVDAFYDARGRVDQVSQPYHADESAHYRDYAYDIRDRVTSVARPDGGRTDIDYACETDAGGSACGHRVQVTVDELVMASGGTTTQRRIELYNVLGELVRTTEGATGQNWTTTASPPTTHTTVRGCCGR